MKNLLKEFKNLLKFKRSDLLIGAFLHFFTKKAIIYKKNTLYI